MPDLPVPIVAALLPQQEDACDALLAELAAALRDAGWTVRGLVQQRCAMADDGQLALLDLERGSSHRITQDLGRAACACALDVQAMAELSSVFRQIAQEGADLVIVNRFGKLESLGEGFAAEMLDIMSRGIPLLTVVQAPYQAAWHTFSGDLATALPAEREAIDAWLDRAVAPYRAGRGA